METDKKNNNLKQPKISVVNYKMGNLRSVENALNFLGVSSVEIIENPEQLDNAERIILPGVGAFATAMIQLKKNGMAEALTENVISKKKPFLGICLGMQLIAKVSHENGIHKGLGWIDAEIRSLKDITDSRVPHIGWNDIRVNRKNDLMNGIDDTADFYFVHGYHVHCKDKQLPLLTCNYGSDFTAALQVNNIFATQFHPEKSQKNGLKLLENFINWRPDNA